MLWVAYLRYVQYIYIYICIYIHTHTYIYIYTHIYTYVNSGKAPYFKADQCMLESPASRTKRAPFLEPRCPSRRFLSCDIHTHTPARKSPTNFQLYYVVIQLCSTNCLGHGHGYECHSPISDPPVRTCLILPHLVSTALPVYCG